MKTIQDKVLSYSKKVGFITKRIAGGYRWTFNLGDVIMKLRKKGHVFDMVMLTNTYTGNRYAIYYYRGDHETYR